MHPMGIEFQWSPKSPCFLRRETRPWSEALWKLDAERRRWDRDPGTHYNPLKPFSEPIGPLRIYGKNGWTKWYVYLHIVFFFRWILSSWWLNQPVWPILWTSKWESFPSGSVWKFKTYWRNCHLVLMLYRKKSEKTKIVRIVQTCGPAMVESQHVLSSRKSWFPASLHWVSWVWEFNAWLAYNLDLPRTKDASQD